MRLSCGGVVFDDAVDFPERLGTWDLHAVHAVGGHRRRGDPAVTQEGAPRAARPPPRIQGLRRSKAVGEVARKRVEDGREVRGDAGDAGDETEVGHLVRRVDEFDLHGQEHHSDAHTDHEHRGVGHREQALATA